MLGIALKNALFNKRRLFGTGLSVVIGIAFLVGTFVFTDTIQRTFDSLFSDVYRNTDAYVRSSSEIDAGFGQTLHGRLPETVVDAVRGVDGVAEAVPSVDGYARIIGSDGKAVGMTNGSPNFGSGVSDSRLIPWTPLPGSRYPNGANEVMVDAGSAKSGKLALGDRVTVVSQGGSRQFTPRRHRLLWRHRLSGRGNVRPLRRANSTIVRWQTR